MPEMIARTVYVRNSDCVALSEDNAGRQRLKMIAQMPADSPAAMPFPIKPGPFRLAMGLQVLEPGAWIRIDADWSRDRALKRDLYRRHGDKVFVALPGTETAQKEIHAMLAAHLVQRFPNRFQQTSGGIAVYDDGQWHQPEDPDRPALLTAAFWVQEDLVLMQADGNGGYRLAAASVSFPTRWRLQEKLGKPIDAIHAPVPDLENRIGRQIRRLFQNFTPDKPLVRENWSIMDNDQLFQPAGHGRATEADDLHAGNVGTKLWLRVERQCLFRLQVCRDILFSIRIYQAPLESVIATPQRAQAMLNAIETMPPDLQRYKSFPVFRRALVGYLENRLSGA